MAALPHDLGPSLHPRTTRPPSASARAWTSPTVTVVCGGVRPSHDADPVALEIDGITWTTPDEGADPAVYRLKDPGRPYIVATIHHGVQSGTVLGPLVDVLSAGPSPSAAPGG